VTFEVKKIDSFTQKLPFQFFVCLILSATLWLPTFNLQAANGAQAITHEPEPEAPAKKPAVPAETAQKKIDNSQENSTAKSPAYVKIKSSTELNQEDLLYYLPEELKQISETTSVLWLEHQSAQFKGVAVLIPDWGQSANSPKQIKQLRTQLTRIGFTTFALQPPAVQMTAANSKENLFQSQNDYRQTLLAQMLDIEKDIQDQPGFKLVLSQGVNTGWLAEFYLNEGLSPPDAMVLLDAYYPELQSNKQMAMSLSKLMFPLMDITTRLSNQWQKNQLQERTLLMQKEIKLDYRQQALILDKQEQRLFKSIYGWLSSLGWY